MDAHLKCEGWWIKLRTKRQRGFFIRSFRKKFWSHKHWFIRRHARQIGYQQFKIIFNKFYSYLFFTLLWKALISKGYSAIFSRRLLWQLQILVKIKFNKVDPFDLFWNCFFNIIPRVRFVPKTSGRRVKLIPVRQKFDHGARHTIRRFLLVSKERTELSFVLKLLGELNDIYNRRGRMLKWKRSIHLGAYQFRDNINLIRYM